MSYLLSYGDIPGNRKQFHAMNPLLPPRYAVASLLVTGVIAGCSAAAPEAPAAPLVVQPGAPGRPARVLPGESAPPTADGAAFTAADVRFMQGMIPHHAQALRMTALVPERTANRDVTLIAKRIRSSQEDEITLMRRWLQERGQDVPGTSHAHPGAEPMPGMLTEEQFAELGKARGAEFDRLFVTYMVGHHMGALRMVEQLFRSDGGQEADIYAYATHVDADQRIEIDRMRRLLATMGGPAPG
ncbi:MAG TPA: DUF305 domain-containing protein [Nonomuraea sp.]|nr:DUF305 domain-containing protein [Nonomuraea sp.]